MVVEGGRRVVRRTHRISASSSKRRTTFTTDPNSDLRAEILPSSSCARSGRRYLGERSGRDRGVIGA